MENITLARTSEWQRPTPPVAQAQVEQPRVEQAQATVVDEPIAPVLTHRLSIHPGVAEPAKVVDIAAVLTAAGEQGRPWAPAGGWAVFVASALTSFGAGIALLS